MAIWKQYELWIQRGEKRWEMLGIFPNTDLPTTLARSRGRRSRLIEVVYDGSKLLAQEVIADMGTFAEEIREATPTSAGRVIRNAG